MYNEFIYHSDGRSARSMREKVGGEQGGTKGGRRERERECVSGLDLLYRTIMKIFVNSKQNVKLEHDNARMHKITFHLLAMHHLGSKIIPKPMK